MALKVTVESLHVEVKKGISSKSGKPFEMCTQVAWVQLVDPTGVPDRHPTKCRISVDEATKPYAIGNYVLPDSAIGVNQWGDFEIKFAKLHAVAAAPVRQAA